MLNSCEAQRMIKCKHLLKSINKTLYSDTTQFMVYELLHELRMDKNYFLF